MHQHCKKLQTLWLINGDSMEDSDIENICNLKSLEELHISLEMYPHRGKFVDSVIRLTNLKSLEIHKSKVYASSVKQISENLLLLERLYIYFFEEEE